MFINSYKFARLQRCSNCGQVIRRVATKTTLILLSIILIGAFLRLYDSNDLLRFNNDQVRDAQIVDEMRQGEIPLLGPKAGGTKFNLGPAFYYLEYLSGAIFGFTPSGIAFFIPILSTISIYLFYLLFKKIFSNNIALSLTFLYAISFYAIKYSHFAWNPNVIPFFIFALLLLLNKIANSHHAQTRHCLVSTQKTHTYTPPYLDFIFLGIIIGIGIQLHTTLLILMPLLTALVFIYLFFKKEKINFRKILVLLTVIIFLNFPFIYGDIINNGENISEFIAGTQTKTENENQRDSVSSLLKNISNTAHFFLQGSAYHLTGFEPQKNWFNIIKLIKSKNVIEISLFIFSVFLFLISFCLIILKKIQTNNNTYKQGSASSLQFILFSFAFLTFLLFVPLGNELNIRFFIILQFLPYLLLGLIASSLKNPPFKKIFFLIFILFILLLAFLNLSAYKKTYDLSNYSAPESAYGGISLGELIEMCSNIEKISQEKNLKEISAENFEFKRSLEYICQKKNVKLNFLSSEKIENEQMFIVIVKNENVLKNIDNYKENFELKNSIKIKRFTLLVFNRN